MESFIITGKAKTVLRFIELKSKYEKAQKIEKKKGKK